METVDGVEAFLEPGPLLALGGLVAAANRVVAAEFGRPVAPAGVLLTWMRGVEGGARGGAAEWEESGVERAGRIHPGGELHVDKANHPDYDISSLFYLSSGGGVDFEGGR